MEEPKNRNNQCPEPPPFELPSQDTRTQNLRPVWRVGSVWETHKSLVVPADSSALSSLRLKALRISAFFPPTQG